MVSPAAGSALMNRQLGHRDWFKASARFVRVGEQESMCSMGGVVRRCSRIRPGDAARRNLTYTVRRPVYAEQRLVASTPALAAPAS